MAGRYGLREERELGARLARRIARLFAPALVSRQYDPECAAAVERSGAGVRPATGVRQP